MSEPFINDGDLAYGSRVLAITNPGVGASAVDFIADDISPDRPSKIAEANNELGAPRGQVGVSTFVSGSATLQLEDSSTNPPQLGATFTEDFGWGSETWFISQVGRQETADGLTKVPVQFRKKYNS